MNRQKSRRETIMTVNIENESENYAALRSGLSKDPEKIIEEIAGYVLDHENCPYESEIDVLITDDDMIREINREQRSIDKSTDVLSFPMIDFRSPSDFNGFDERYELFEPDSGELLLGDIVLSAEHVMSQAKEYGHSSDRELAFLVTHSMLHLLGYDHMEDADREVMEQKQREILDEAGYCR